MKNKLLINFKKKLGYILIFSIFILGVSVVSTVNAVTSSTLTIGSQSASVGETVNVPIEASDFNNAVAGMDFTVHYDNTLLAYSGLTENAILGHGTLLSGNTADSIIINWHDTEALAVDDGTILTLNFLVLSSDTLDTDLSFTGTLELNDLAANLISADFINGVLTLNPDETSPIIFEVTPVTTPSSNTTPEYTFNSNEAGTISYGGSCSSAVTVATVGDNTIVFNTLAEGLYNNCTITVTDSNDNVSDILAITDFLVDPVAPATLYVSTLGNDNTGNGSVGTPYATIQKAIDEANSGDTINVAEGTYNGSILVNKNLTILGDIGDDNAGASATAPVLNNADVYIGAAGVTSVTFSGFQLLNYTAINVDIMETVDSGSISMTENSFISNSSSSAIFLIGDGISIQKNTFTATSIIDSILDTQGTNNLNFSYNEVEIINAPVFAGGYDNLLLFNNLTGASAINNNSVSFTNASEVDGQTTGTITIDGDNTTGTISISNNTLTGTGVDGFTKDDNFALFIFPYGLTGTSTAVPDTSVPSITIDNNTITGYYGGLRLRGGNFEVTNNTVTGIGTYINDSGTIFSNYGINLALRPDSIKDITLNIAGNSFTNHYYGITAGSSLTHISAIDNNNLTGNYYGLHLNLSGSGDYAQVDDNIINNDFKNNEYSAFENETDVEYDLSTNDFGDHDAPIFTLTERQTGPGIPADEQSVTPGNQTKGNTTLRVDTEDEAGSGIKNAYYCVDTDNTCTPNSNSGIMNVNGGQFFEFNICRDGGCTPSVTVITEQYTEQVAEDYINRYVRYIATDNPGNQTEVQSVNIYIDTTNPTVVNVTSDTESGHYKAGEIIIIDVIYDESIIFDINDGIPFISLDIEGVQKNLHYDSGLNTNTLKFKYIVEAGDDTSEIICLNSFAKNGTTLTDLAGNYTIDDMGAPGDVNSFNYNRTITIDTITPTFNGKLGNGTEDYTIPAGATVQLVFSETLSTAVKADIENMINGGADQDIDLGWSNGTLLIVGHVDNVTSFENDITASSIADEAGNELGETLLIDSKIEDNEVSGEGEVTVTETQNQVVISTLVTSNITIPEDVTGTNIDVSSLITGNTGTIPAINIDADTSIGNVLIQIPSSTITGGAGWDGTITPPTVQANSSVTPNESGQTVSTVIEIGYGDVKLTFDKAVKIVLPGQYSKKAGYTRLGVFTEITTVCTANTQAAGDALAAEGDCKINEGDDLVIWTKHFTKFATYVSAPTSGGGGGGISTPYNPAPQVLGVKIEAEPVEADEKPEPEVLGVKFGNSRFAQIQKINSDALSLMNGVEAVLMNTGMKRNIEKEKIVSNKYIISLIGATSAISQDSVYTLTNFVTYGTSTTIALGEGERAGVVNSFKSTFGKLPATQADWSDVVKIANGRWPDQRNTQAEANAEKMFERIYLKKADRGNAYDDAAVTIMTYGLRPDNRNLDSENSAINSFKYIFRYNPVSAADWDVIRAIAYSGSTR